MRAIVLHGDSRTRLYRIWIGIKKRCLNPNNYMKERYIERGITICDEWKDFLTFKKWAIENGYKENLSIDRINNDGNYEPENCRWTTGKEQSNNKSNNHSVTFNGETHNISWWADLMKTSTSNLGNRIKRYGIEKALTSPIGLINVNKIEYNGLLYTINELADKHSIVHASVLRMRIKSGWDIEKALLTPVLKNKKNHKR